MIDSSGNRKTTVMVFKEIGSVFVIPTVSKETIFISKDPDPWKSECVLQRKMPSLFYPHWNN